MIFTNADAMISFKEQLPDFAGRYHGGSFMTVKPPDFGGKPYRSLDYHLRNRYGEKIYKVSLDGGMTCPNRDGTLGKCGCIFCSEGGSVILPVTGHTRFISRLRNRRLAFPRNFRQRILLPIFRPTPILTLRFHIWSVFLQRRLNTKTSSDFRSAQDRTACRTRRWICYRS